MQESQASQIAQAFVERWNTVFQTSDSLRLDYSWPSIAVCDQLLYPLRGKSQLKPEERELVGGAAAYITVIAHQCWAMFAESVSVGVDKSGLMLKASGGEFIPQGQVIEYPVEAALARVLRENQPEFHILGTLSKKLLPGANIVSLFALGVCTGLGPDRKGAWTTQTETDLDGTIQVVVKKLAATCAEYYERLHPSESFGQVAELYLEGLIYPPLGVDETVLGQRAVNRLLNFFAEYGVKPQSIAQLVYNLSISADDQLSCAGLALFGAVSSQTPPAALLAAAQARGSVMAELRPAMLTVRKRLGLSEDWAKTAAYDKAAIARIRIEQAMGFVPWLYFDIEKLTDSSESGAVSEAFARISSNNMESAITSTDSAMASANGLKFDLQIQRAKLELVRGNLDSAAKLCKSAASDPAAQQSPRFRALAGLCSLQKQDTRGALAHFQAATQLPSEDPLLQVDIFNNLGWTLLSLGDLKDAVAAFDAGIKKSPCPVTLLLNKAYVLWQQSDIEALREVRAQLFALAPTDRRVFASMVIEI